MHSLSEAVILAADGLSALDKERTDHSSISDKGEVSSSSTFCYLCHLSALGLMSLQTGVISAD